MGESKGYFPSTDIQKVTRKFWKKEMSFFHINNPKVPKKVSFYLLSKVEKPGSKCSEGLRSLPKAKKLGIVSPSLAVKAKEAPFRRSRSILAPSIYSTSRLFKARKINSTVIKTENISSYETGLQERRLTCSTGGSLVPPMSLEMSAFMEEVESLHTQGMEVTGPHVSPLPTTPIGCEVAPNQVTRNIKYLAPKPQGKKLIVKVPSNDTAKPEVCSLPDDHDYYWNEFENQSFELTQENNNQLFGVTDLPGLFPDLKLEQEIEESLITQVHNYEDTFNTQNITATENTIEEIIVPVVTHNNIQAHQESDQYVIIKSENTEESYKMKNSLNDEWATESLFPELREGSQNSEDPFQAHNPFEVTGQVLPQEANAIDENPFTASGEMDLLATVLNDEIDVNSEEFQNFIALENEPDTEMSTINYEDIMGTPSTSGMGSPVSGFSVEVKEEPMEATGVFMSKPVKKGRGRPRVPRTAVVEPPRRPRGRPPTAQMVADVDSCDRDSSSAMSSSEQKEHRYQRMRQLNNAASKRCRINRKRKQETQEDEQILLTARNMELKGKVADLESQVAKFKTAIFDMIKKRKTEQVETCPEVVSATSAAASKSQNDSSILSFDLEFF